jgi:hypothetical protein
MTASDITATQPFTCDDCGAVQSTMFQGKWEDYVPQPHPEGWRSVTVHEVGLPLPGVGLKRLSYCPDCKEKHG